MKKNINVPANQLTKAPTVQISLPSTGVTGHNVTINPNANSFAESLGIEGDRAKELEGDIIAACNAAIKAIAEEDPRFNLTQVIAIAATHAQSDNELVYVTALISEAVVSNDWKNLKAETQEELDAQSAPANTTDGDQNGMPQGFGDFLRMIMEAQGAEGMLAGGEDNEEDQDLKENN